MTPPRLPALFGAVLLCVIPCAVRADAPAHGLLDRTFTDADGKEAKYALFVPHDYNGDKAYPLVLFLHGAGETGNDGKRQTYVGLGPVARMNAEKFHFFILFPQSQEHTWAADSRDEYDLRLMFDLKDVSDIPTEDKNRVIVADVNRLLHFRIFDIAGKMVVDTDENRLPAQAGPINKLREQLQKLRPPHELSRSEKAEVVTTVTSIVGHTPRDARRALDILAAVQKEYKIDDKRLYLTGLSMGGFGTWGLAAKYPDRWAAIVPICGGGDPEQAKAIKDIPCWVFHGDADPAVPVTRSRDMIQALKAVGGQPRYDEFAGVGHNSWEMAYNTPALYEWLLQQHK